MTNSNTHLVRTKNGRMVHKRGCSYASWGKPWEWAEGKGHHQIALSVIGLGVNFCKRCEPLVGLPADQEDMPLRGGTCPEHGEYNNFSGRCLACIPAGELVVTSRSGFKIRLQDAGYDNRGNKLWRELSTTLGGDVS